MRPAASTGSRGLVGCQLLVYAPEPQFGVYRAIIYSEKWIFVFPIFKAGGMSLSGLCGHIARLWPAESDWQ